MKNHRTRAVFCFIFILTAIVLAQFRQVQGTDLFCRKSAATAQPPRIGTVLPWTR